MTTRTIRLGLHTAECLEELVGLLNKRAVVCGSAVTWNAQDAAGVAIQRWLEDLRDQAKKWPASGAVVQPA